LYISYITGEAGHSFGNPPRIGYISGEGYGLFLDERLPPAADLFFDKLKGLLPFGYKLIAAYSKRGSYLEEKYVFKSGWLTSLKGIKDALPYQSIFGIKGDPVGVFQLIVNYDINDNGRVANFTLCLGRDDNSDMRKMSKNPFK
jgi:hypothetical protein